MDAADIANDNITSATDERVRAITGRELPKGEPGDCSTCGEFSGRLVRDMCAPCRERYEPEER